MKKLVKENINEAYEPYFSHEKVKKLIEDVEHFMEDVNGDASIKRYAGKTSGNAIITAKNFLTSLKNLETVIRPTPSYKEE